MDDVARAVSRFGAEAKAKLAAIAITGQPEDQLRGPLESFFKAMAEPVGLAPESLILVGETALGDLKIRPDFAVSVRNALVGFIEVKAPGKGFDPRAFSDPHDKKQWEKLKALPNLLYTDGNGFSLWHDGKLEARVEFAQDIETAGSDLAVPPGLAALLSAFLNWSPTPPTRARALAQVSARLCRLLRDEVVEQMEAGNSSLTGLAKDWRRLLFPEANDATFADGYAQAVTFGLLVARARDIDLAEGIEPAARELRSSSSIIATALRLLTDETENQKALKTSLGTLVRVLQEVDWHRVSRDRPEAWLYFYEDFLDVYDPKLRRRTGSYYTPPEVVQAMTRLTDEALRGPLFDLPSGLAHDDVKIVDPATGTGTFLLGALRQIAEDVKADLGPGAVPGSVASAAERLIGFELQFGPFAVAQLRLLAEFQGLMQRPGGEMPTLPDLRLFVTDTLGNPYGEEEEFMQIARAIGESRREANRVKREEEITVVIGNPPYKEKAKGRGGWVENGGQFAAPLDWWQPPAEWGVGAHAKHLRNLYVYFWRWAAWKVFGSGHKAATGEEPRDGHGIVCFITAAGYLHGPGFQRMREDLRRSSSDIWVIDCSPEGFRPDTNTRIFQDVKHTVCITLAVRQRNTDEGAPAKVRYRSLGAGRREAKFTELSGLSLATEDWETVSSEWRASFLPEAEGAWADFVPLKDFFTYDGSGVMPGRTWVIAPDRETLERRWVALIAEKDPVRKEALFHPQLRGGKVASRHVKKIVEQGLGSLPPITKPLVLEMEKVPRLGRYAFRSFDRQWFVQDARVLNDVRPLLWKGHSGRQIYLTALGAQAPERGPALTITATVPDQDHFSGRGGRVFPLHADAAATRSNLDPTLLAVLSDLFVRPVSGEDMLAYIVALLAHPAYTARFREDLRQPGLRVPLTADPALFAEATSVGRRIVWLHTYGERFADPAEGRPARAPRKMDGPTIPEDGAIPGAPEPLPETLRYDAAARRLHVGKGFVDNVSPDAYGYEVSGRRVVDQWFSSRRRDRTKPQIGDKRPPSDLQKIQPDHWLAEYTRDLVDLLHVLTLLTELEEAQADLLERILAGPLIDRAELFGVQDAGDNVPAGPEIGEGEG